MYIGIQPTEDSGIFVEEVICLNGTTSEYERVPVYDIFPRDKLDALSTSVVWLLKKLGLN